MKIPLRRITVFFLVLSVSAGLITACSAENGGGEKKESSSSETGTAEEISSLKTTFIKCGKADIIILECGNETMVIDTGENDDGDKITEYLAEQEIEKVDELIITHFDKDHVGGAAFLLGSIPVDRIYVPDYEGTSDEYFAFTDALAAPLQEGSGSPTDSGDRLVRLSESVSFTLGDATVLIDPPSSYEVPDDGKEYDNDLSLVTIVEHGENTLLFMGDAEKPRIRDYMDKALTDSCDLIKIPHHGNYNSALKDLISSQQPEYAVITDSEKNPAEDKTLDMLEMNGVQVFRTSQGDVTAVSDGASLSVTD